MNYGIWCREVIIKKQLLQWNVQIMNVPTTYWTSQWSFIQVS